MSAASEADRFADEAERNSYGSNIPVVSALLAIRLELKRIADAVEGKGGGVRTK